MKYLGLLGVVLLLAACESSPYEPGKSPADVPAHVGVISLKKVFLYGGEADDPQKDSGPHQAPEPLEEKDPSQNDLEVLAMAKANIVNQLTNFGYTVVEDNKTRADIGMSFAVSYMPERVILVHRAVGIRGSVYSPDGTLLFKLGVGKTSTAGVFGSMLQGHDDLVSECTREAVVKVITEMRKGTLENTPVSKKKKLSSVDSDSTNE